MIPDLEKLADWLDSQLDNANADRQTICEEVSSRLLQLAADLVVITPADLPTVLQAIGDGVHWRDHTARHNGAERYRLLAARLGCDL